jgi:type I restriction enzyme S subunit
MSDRQISLDEVGEVNDNSEDDFRSIRIGPRKLRIPTDWEIRPLDPEEGATSRVTDGAHHSPNQSEDGEYYYATVSDMSSDRIDYDGCGLIDSEQYNNLVEGDCKPRRGEVLFSKDGTVGLTTVFNDDVDVVLLSSIAMIDPVDDILNSHYLSQYLSSDFTEFQIQSLKSGTAIRRVVLMDIEKIEVPIPSLSEQRKIATVLHTVDQAIQKTEEIIKQKERIRTGLMQDVFTGVDADSTKSVRLSAVDTEIPKHWEVKTVGEVSIQITDGAHLTPDRSEEGYLLLSARNVKNGYLDLSEVDYVPEEEYERLIEKCNPQSGDILISCSGTVGRVCEVPEDLDFALIRSAALVKFDNSLVSSYAEKVLQSVGVQKQIKSYQTQSAQPNLFQGQIASLEIPIPPIEEQRDIAEKLDDISGSIKSDQQYQSQLKRLKRGLMQDLLSGEVRAAGTNIGIPEEVAKYG